MGGIFFGDVMSSFFDAVKNRRSIYTISDKSTISDEKIIQILRDSLLNTPSSFNSQSSRLAVFFGKDNKKVWDTVKDVLRAKVPADRFSQTEERINLFSAGYGTVLYFEDMSVVAELQNKFPSYKDNFPVWSAQSSGILQYIVWTALSAEGLGATLQHYNPIIDESLNNEFAFPKSWKLMAQMPFGLPVGEAAPKDSLPIDDRLLIFK